MKTVWLVVAVTVMLGGCTSVTVKPVNGRAALKHVCIQENPKVAVADFTGVLTDGFNRHGISSELFSGAAPERCSNVLTYVAYRNWDFAPYLSKAELRLMRDGRQIGYAEYHLRGIFGNTGGLSMMKWQSTKTKMDPVIDKLLGGA